MSIDHEKNLRVIAIARDLLRRSVVAPRQRTSDPESSSPPATPPSGQSSGSDVEAPDRDVIDRSGLARRLDVHPRTIDRMVLRGELPPPCVGAGGRPRWLWSYVMQHLKARHDAHARLEARKNRKLKSGAQPPPSTSRANTNDPSNSPTQS